MVEGIRNNENIFDQNFLRHLSELRTHNIIEVPHLLSWHVSFSILA